VGQTDLRDALCRGMASLLPDTRVRQPLLEERHGGRVLQYIGGIDKPSQIGSLTADARVVYDFRTDRVMIGQQWKARPELSVSDAAAFRELVYRWEAVRLARARKTGAVP